MANLQARHTGGQQSLQTFATGIFLSFTAYFVLIETTDTIWMQILVNIVGIAILTLLAWYKNWTTRMDKPRLQPEASAPPAPGSSSVTGVLAQNCGNIEKAAISPSRLHTLG
jgi:hypothetical protein